ncbi:MAG: hypothetical protein GC159_18970 [Phycisphaera sp.]|nr:hypothetical protein [Phycisphaera sp.]
MNPPPRSNAKKWLFRIGALLLGLLPFVVLEVTLTAMGVGDAPPVDEDPYVSFAELRPLFYLEQDKGVYRTSAWRTPAFAADRFDAVKPAGEFRVFCLGGSTVQGRPFSIDTSFTTWLELALNAGDASRRARVINCGGISYASYRLVPILREVLDYQPDLIIVYTGHNEFLEDRTYANIKALPDVALETTGRATQLRTIRLLRSWLASDRPRRDDDAADRSVMPPDVKAKLDEGLEQYTRDVEWRRGIIEHYRVNIRRMVDLCDARGVPIVLCDPACNLRDCPPFKSQPTDGLDDPTRAQVASLVAEARDASSVAPRSAVAALESAVKLDPDNAALWYELGEACDAAGMIDRAAEAYNHAKECDICPLRAIDAFGQAVRDAISSTDAIYVDARGVLSKQCRDGIPGNEMFIDHVHPSIHGHKLLAAEIARVLDTHHVVTLSSDWRQRAEAAWATHEVSLPPLYYEKGMLNLKQLNTWARHRRSSSNAGVSAAPPGPNETP